MARPRRLALFAHYDGEGQVRPYIVHYLRALSEVVDDIVFITAGSTTDEALEVVRSFGRVLVRENVGYDFGSWKHALEDVDVKEWDELILANSSCFGPLGDGLNRVFDEMDQVDTDLWGMTDSRQIERHLQSYFLVFRKTALHSSTFEKFWSSVLLYANKRQLIRSYEVGLTLYFEDAGFSCKAFVPAERAIPLIGRTRWPKLKVNPTLRFPVRLIKLGMPLVKVELFRDNPYRLSLRAMRKILIDANYDLALIEFGRASKKRLIPWRAALPWTDTTVWR